MRAFNLKGTQYRALLQRKRTNCCWNDLVYAILCQNLAVGCPFGPLFQDRRKDNDSSPQGMQTELHDSRRFR